MSDYFGNVVGAGAPAAWSPGTPAGVGVPGFSPYPPAGGPPPSYGWPPAPAEGPSVARIVIGVVVALVALPLIGAVVIPVVLDMRARWTAAHTTVALPAQLAGLPRLTDARSVQLADELRSAKAPGRMDAALYGDGERVVAVAAAHVTFGYGDQAASLRGALRGAASRAPGLLFHDVPPGRLGGRMECAAAPSGATLCFFADPGAFGTVVVLRGGEELAPLAREGVEHRT